MAEPRAYRNLVFSGGGLACLASWACARSLRAQIAGVTTVAGTSAGALVAALVALDADDATTYRGFMTALRRDSPVEHARLSRVLETFGAVSSETFTRGIVERILMPAYNMAELCSGRDPSNAPPTFREFASLTGRNLIVAAVNINRAQTVFFSVDTHPDLSVVDAIVASCALPLIFTPVRIGGDLHVDGGLTDNLPLAALPPGGLPGETLAIDTRGAEADRGAAGDGDSERTPDFFSFLKQTLNAVVRESNQRASRPEHVDIVFVDTVARSDVHVDSLLGAVTQATIDSLYAAGVRAARAFESTGKKL